MPKVVNTDSGLVHVDDIPNGGYLTRKINGVSTRLYKIHTDKETFIQMSTEETREKHKAPSRRPKRVSGLIVPQRERAGPLDVHPPEPLDRLKKGYFPKEPEHRRQY